MIWAPQQCLVVAIDVGKRAAMAMVADHYGQIVDEPFEFTLTVSGVDRFVATVAAAEAQTSAGSVRVGVEAAGHYHRALASTLRGKGFDVVELNPYQVKTAVRSWGRRGRRPICVTAWRWSSCWYAGRGGRCTATTARSQSRLRW